MHHYSLKFIFSLIFALYSILFLVFQTFALWTAFHQFNLERTQKTQDYLDSTATLLADNIDNHVNIQNYLTQNYSLINFLRGQNPEVSELSFLEDVWMLKRFSASNFNISLFDDAKQKISLSQNQTDYPPEIAETFFKLYQRDGTNIYFYKSDESILNEIYFLSFMPITAPNTSYAAIDNLGTLAVISKINLTEIGNLLSFDDNLEICLKGPQGNQIYLTQQHENLKTSTTKVCSIEDTDWTLVGYYQYTYTQSLLFQIILIFALESFVLFLFMLILQMIYKKFIDVPIVEISGFLSKYLITKKGTLIQKQHTKELDTLVHHINKMLQRNEALSRMILQNQQNLYERELSEKSTLLYALQVQVNPHFLYNTLDCIKSIAYLRNVPEITEISIALAHMMRYSISGQSLVAVEAEISMLKDYYAILKIRYIDHFQLQMDIDDSILDKKMMKMILQPIVENAAKHNQSYANPLTVQISGKQDGNLLIFSVLDNGQGIQEDILKHLSNDLCCPSHIATNNTHLGLKNINNRIKLYYGSAYGLSIESKKGEYTKISIRIPVVPDDYTATFTDNTLK